MRTQPRRRRPVRGLVPAFAARVAGGDDGAARTSEPAQPGLDARRRRADPQRLGAVRQRDAVPGRAVGRDQRARQDRPVRPRTVRGRVGLVLAVFAHPVHRRLLLAQIVSLLGAGLATVALALVAHDLAGPRAALVLGIALAIRMIAMDARVNAEVLRMAARLHDGAKHRVAPADARPYDRATVRPRKGRRS